MDAKPHRRIDTGTDELLCELRERVAVITLNRPDARNALSDVLSPALRATIRRCADDDAVGSLLLTGAGTTFCAGGDVKGMAVRSAKRTMSFAERVADLRERQRALTGALVASRKPTVAALPGPAIGAGLAIALACDIRFAAASAFVATGYARIGLSGDYGIASLLTRLVGTGRARELMFGGDRLDAARAEAIGLVNRVVPDADLQAEAFAFARKIANGPSKAISLMKDNLDDALEVDFDTALDREAERLVQSSQTADHAEALRAFVEKRPPNFSGR
jgi:enoyl-CoA hydratase/carnithine racemase